MDSFYGGIPGNVPVIKATFSSYRNMEEAFSLGAAYTECFYGEYCYINSDDEYHGNVYRRGYGGPEYIGNFAGPRAAGANIGFAALGDLIGTDDEQKTYTNGEIISYSGNAGYTVADAGETPKKLSFNVGNLGLKIFKDGDAAKAWTGIDYAWVAKPVEGSNDEAITTLGLEIPVPYFEFDTKALESYDENGAIISSIKPSVKLNTEKRGKESPSPFYFPFDLEIPNAPKTCELVEINHAPVDDIIRLAEKSRSTINSIKIDVNYDNFGEIEDNFSMKSENSATSLSFINDNNEIVLNKVVKKKDAQGNYSLYILVFGDDNQSIVNLTKVYFEKDQITKTRYLKYDIDNIVYKHYLKIENLEVAQNGMTTSGVICDPKTIKYVKIADDSSWQLSIDEAILPTSADGYKTNYEIWYGVLADYSQNIATPDKYYVYLGVYDVVNDIVKSSTNTGGKGYCAVSKKYTASEPDDLLLNTSAFIAKIYDSTEANSTPKTSTDLNSNINYKQYHNGLIAIVSKDSNDNPQTEFFAFNHDNEQWISLGKISGTNEIAYVAQDIPTVKSFTWWDASQDYKTYSTPNVDITT